MLPRLEIADALDDFHQKYVEGDLEFQVPSEDNPGEKRPCNWADVFEKYVQELYEISCPPLVMQEGQHRKTPVIFGKMVEERPVEWDERFCSFLRLNKFGIVSTPSEENGHGPIHIRREVLVVDEEGGTPVYKYIAKYLRSGISIDSPESLPRDGNCKMRYIIVAYVPQAHEECVTMIGSVFGKGVWTHISAFQVTKRKLTESERARLYGKNVPAKEWDAAEEETESVKETVDEVNVEWTEADRCDLRHGLDPRVQVYGIPGSVQDVNRHWSLIGSQVLKRLEASPHAAGKNFPRFNSQLLVIELFKVKRGSESYFSKLPEEQVFVKSVEMLTNCLFPINLRGDNQPQLVYK